jgi:hypothetical protein
MISRFSQLRDPRGTMRSIRWNKQAVNIPLRQLAHSMMDLGLSLETQSNLSKDHQEAVWAFIEKPGRTLSAAEHYPSRQREDRNETHWQGCYHLRRGIRHGGGHGTHIRA